jgi:hypothetical protein
MVVTVEEGKSALLSAQDTRSATIEMAETPTAEDDGVLWRDYPRTVRARRALQCRHGAPRCKRGRRSRTPLDWTPVCVNPGAPMVGARRIAPTARFRSCSVATARADGPSRGTLNRLHLASRVDVPGHRARVNLASLHTRTREAHMDQATLRLRIRERAAVDSRALLVAGDRLSRQSFACIERSGNYVIRSRALLVLCRARLDSPPR